MSCLIMLPGSQPLSPMYNFCSHESVVCIITIFYSWFSLQAKADEIAKLMNENEQFKALIEDLKVYLFFQYRVVRIMLCFNSSFFIHYAA